MLVIVSDNSAITSFIRQLSECFNIKNLGLASTFHGIQIVPHANGFLIQQTHYANQILEKVGILQAKLVKNLLPSKLHNSLSPFQMQHLPYDH